MGYMRGGDDDDNDNEDNSGNSGKSFKDKFNTCVSEGTWRMIYLILAGVLIFITFVSREFDENKKYEGMMPIIAFWLHLALIGATAYAVLTKNFSSNLSMMFLIVSFLWSQLIIIKQTDPVYLYTLAKENEGPAPTTPGLTDGTSPTTAAPVSQQVGGAVGLATANLVYGVGSGLGSGLGAIGGYFDGVMGRSSKNFMYLMGLTSLNVIMLVSGMNAFPCGSTKSSGSSDE